MRKLPNAKLPLPEFDSSEDAARFFESHSVSEIWDRLPKVEGLRLSKELEKAIRGRKAQRKSPVSVRLDSAQIDAAKKIAAAKSVGYQTQLRIWIEEGIRREAKR